MGDIATLALLDVSAAFDTVNHDILLERICQLFGIAVEGTASSSLTLLDGPNQSAVTTSRSWPFQLIVAYFIVLFWGRFCSFLTWSI